MALQETHAFVLYSIRVNESDKICSFYSRNSGKVRGIASGASKPTSRFGASLEPLTEVLIEFYMTEGNELVYLRRCELIHSFFTHASHPEGQVVASYIAEIIDHFSPLQDPNEKVFRLIAAVIESLLKAFHRWEAILLYLEVWLLKLGGFFPVLGQCNNCNRMILNEEPVYLGIEGRPECMTCHSVNVGVILPPFVKRQVNKLLTKSPFDWATEVEEFEKLKPFGLYIRKLLGNIVERELKTVRFIKTQP
jgi:DNA repair protein RecO (recombination protein O)